MSKTARTVCDWKFMVFKWNSLDKIWKTQYSYNNLTWNWSSQCEEQNQKHRFFWQLECLNTYMPMAVDVVWKIAQLHLLQPFFVRYAYLWLLCFDRNVLAKELHGNGIGVWWQNGDQKKIHSILSIIKMAYIIDCLVEGKDIPWSIPRLSHANRLFI